jgi:hypothetical protein
MATRNFKLGRWYESKDDVRRFFGEYRKGILRTSRRTAIIFNYRGARRVHYGDRLDFKTGKILYIGEGKRGNQIANARNQSLIDASKSKKPIDVFLDCGDLFKPKRLLYAGRWVVSNYRYSALNRQEPRKVFKFSLVPATEKVLDFLHFSFSALGRNPAFEDDLKQFAKARSRLYALHSDVLRSRDNISGEIGEYFAIKAFNRKAGKKHLIRLTGSFRDIDAIQIENGKRIAIKTISTVPSSTSNIWSKDIMASVDAFLVCCLNHETLTPDFVASITVKQAFGHLKIDRYQGTNKLKIGADLLRRARFLEGDKSHWI